MSEVALLESIYNETERADEADAKGKSVNEHDNSKQFKSAVDFMKSTDKKSTQRKHKETDVGDISPKQKQNMLNVPSTMFFDQISESINSQEANEEKIGNMLNHDFS